MASSYAPWWRRVLYRTPLYKKCPAENYHWFRERWCACRLNEYYEGWHGGIYCFADGKEYVFDPTRSPVKFD